MKKQLLSALAIAFSVAQAAAQCSPCTIPFVAASQATGNSASVTIPIPAGVVQGDVMIAAIHHGWCNNGPAVIAPNGWTLINYTSNTGSGCGSSNTTIQLATFYKVAGASEPANYTFTGNSSNQAYVGGIVAYSGVNTANPIHMNSNNGAQDACNNLLATGFTTTQPCTRLVAVFFCSVNNSATNIVPQNSLTERVDVSTTGNNPWGNENLEIADELMMTAGATGNKTAALTGCSSTGWVTGAQLIALSCQAITGQGEHSLSEMFTVIPNPSTGKFNLKMAEFENLRTAKLEIYNLVGEKIYSANFQTVSSSNFQIDLSTQPKGIYFLRVSTLEGVITRKIVLE
ncbi:MAG: T9SS type A sorting domain-containing protein [Bacteroidota bacterium]